MGGKQAVGGLDVLIDGTVKILPLTIDLDIRLVHPPALADLIFLAVSKSGLQFRYEFLDPAVEIRMINRRAPLRHPVFWFR
jgi:hypothetical protein